MNQVVISSQILPSGVKMQGSEILLNMEASGLDFSFKSLDVLLTRGLNTGRTVVFLWYQHVGQLNAGQETRNHYCAPTQLGEWL